MALVVSDANLANIGQGRRGDWGTRRKKWDACRLLLAVIDRAKDVRFTVYSRSPPIDRVDRYLNKDLRTIST
jgi:hypothetical protein